MHSVAVTVVELSSSLFQIYLPTLLKQMEKEKGSVEEPEAIEEDTPV